MADLHQQWGDDLTLSPSGDLLLVDGSEAGRQRVLRRLFTNSGDLIFHPDYGAGLPRRIGETTLAAALEVTVRRQIFLEPVVARDPPPKVDVTPIFGGAIVRVVYADAATAEAQPIGATIQR